MFLIKSQLDNENTTVRLHHYDNNINMNDFPTRQYITMGHSVRLSISIPPKEG